MYKFSIRSIKESIDKAIWGKLPQAKKRKRFPTPQEKIKKKVNPASGGFR